MLVYNPDAWLAPTANVAPTFNVASPSVASIVDVTPKLEENASTVIDAVPFDNEIEEGSPIAKLVLGSPVMVNEASAGVS